MKKVSRLRFFLAVTLALSIALITASNVVAQGQSGGKAASKQDMKQLNKEANKLEAKADEAADQLKSKFNSLTDFPFGQFVAAVLLADRIDKPLDDIIAKLVAGMSIGQITKEADINMGEVRSGFGQFRSELARSETNPPTKDCFKTTP